MELQLEAWNKLSPGSQEEVSPVSQFYSHLLKNMDTMHVVPAPVCVCQESAASSMWHQYQHLTSALSQQLCEQLRLILEPTQAAKLKSGPIYSQPCDFSYHHWIEEWNSSFFFPLFPRGDYRTGKRLNMRKVIPYIASQFRKDKIWLRRTKPSKRDYQICLAIDDSSSMVDNHSKQVSKHCCAPPNVWYKSYIFVQIATSEQIPPSI